MDKKTKLVICTAFSNGKKHDFKLFKESKVRWTKERCGLTDSGYAGIQKLQKNSGTAKKIEQEEAFNKRGKEAKPKNLIRESRE